MPADWEVPCCNTSPAPGVGVLGIIDADTLHESNLHRQPIYALAEVGSAKAALAAAAVARINPAVRVEVHGVRFDADNALPLVRASRRGGGLQR